MKNLLCLHYKKPFLEALFFRVKLQLHLFISLYSDTERTSMNVRVVLRSEVLPGTQSLSVIYDKLTSLSRSEAVC